MPSAPPRDGRPIVPVSPLHNLTEEDLSAAEALADAMSGWNAGELATYRSAVEEELAALGRAPVHGFLAVELAALQVVSAAHN